MQGSAAASKFFLDALPPGAWRNPPGVYLQAMGAWPSRQVRKAVANGPALLQHVDGVNFHEEARPTLQGGGAQMNVDGLSEIGAVLQAMAGDVRLTLHLALHQAPGVA